MTRLDNYTWYVWLAFLDRVSDVKFYCREKIHVFIKVNFTVTALTACFILYTRSAGAVYFAIGAVFCSLSVKLVKRIIRQPRPPNLPGRQVKISYGCVEGARLLQNQDLTLIQANLPQHAEYSLCYDQLLCGVHLPRMSISSSPSNTSAGLVYSHNFPPGHIPLRNNDCHV